MSKLSFVKYQAAGNDFILIDDRKASFPISIVKKLCDRKRGIGADGVILLQTDQKSDFRMRIFNCDGTEAESCGNGLQCLALFLSELGLPHKKYTIALTGCAAVLEAHSERVSLFLGKPLHCNCLRIAEEEVFSLNTGVPHAVVFVTDLKKLDVVAEGRRLRHHPLFGKEGTNVNFASIQSGKIAVRTYERGLEGESWACGTGAAAVAYIAQSCFHIPNPVKIIFKGGELEVIINEAQEIELIGTPSKVFEGKWQLN